MARIAVRHADLRFFKSEMLPHVYANSAIKCFRGLVWKPAKSYGIKVWRKASTS